ncbi:MAG: ribonuclease HII [Ruthenibacterium sp.]
MGDTEKSQPLYAFDAAYAQQYGVLCGVDEAGRGPLCGPVCVAAVILDPAVPIAGLNDSKKLTEKKREALFPQIMEHAVSYKIVMVGPEIIDEINILQATMLGMCEAIEGLSTVPALALIDGNRCPQTAVQTLAVVKGDANSASIAAASILAKVSRDRYMTELSEKFPQYHLEKHKGYPTAEHYALLDQYGIEAFYRKSFLKKRGYV